MLDKITSADLKNKRVLLRVDFNVPVNDVFEIQDMSRIQNVKPTIQFLQKAGAKIILISHMGNQNGDVKSLKFLVKTIEQEFKTSVIFVEKYIENQKALDLINNASEDNIILLENLRTYKEEEKCNDDFSAKLAALADFYINDAFSVSHRNHASICQLPKLMPHAFGFAFEKEVQEINNFLSNAKSPTMSIVGGSKLSTKIKLLKNLVKHVDKLALGGGIANVFLAYKKHPSFNEDIAAEYQDDLKEIYATAEKNGCEIILPIDFSTVINLGNTKKYKIIVNEKIEGNVYDIGPASVELFKKHIKESATVLWNGPVGMFEQEPFDLATKEIAKEVAKLSLNGELESLVGGGDTASAMHKFNCAKSITYQSTSGGAFLMYLEGKVLPGIAAMKNAYKLIS